MDAPGRGAKLFETARRPRMLVINLLGRVHMDALDDPFAAVERSWRPARWAWSPTP